MPARPEIPVLLSDTLPAAIFPPAPIVSVPDMLPLVAVIAPLRVAFVAIRLPFASSSALAAFHVMVAPSNLK